MRGGEFEMPIFNIRSQGLDGHQPSRAYIDDKLSPSLPPSLPPSLFFFFFFDQIDFFVVWQIMGRMVQEQ
jgi:hypothetical protein